ncbi:MAG: MBL fold metallo-hydrolase [archaeon]
MIDNIAAGVNVFTSNVFLLRGERTVLVDAGNQFDVVTAIRERTDRLDAVVLTHTHPDHVGNIQAVVDAFDVDVWGFDPEAPGVEHALADGDSIQMGEDDYTVLHTPGHKNDHVCLYACEPGILFAGDLIFANGGFGRTDLAEGDRRQLVESIGRLLSTVEEDLEVLYAGHGPSVRTAPYESIELAYRAARM